MHHFVRDYDRWVWNTGCGGGLLGSLKMSLQAGHCHPCCVSFSGDSIGLFCSKHLEQNLCSV